MVVVLKILVHHPPIVMNEHLLHKDFANLLEINQKNKNSIQIR
jgi:hypothetical protein